MKIVIFYDVTPFSLVEQTAVLIPCLPHNYPLHSIDVYLPFLFDAVQLKRCL